MDADRFDTLTRSLTRAASSRRRLLTRIARGALGGAAATLGLSVTEATHFDCRHVGIACTRTRQCCSGICRGPQGKKTCRAHGAGTCKQGEPGICTAPQPELATCNNDADCGCVVTTGGSSFCGDFFVPSGCGKACTDCAVCKRDADCVRKGFPPGSACAPFSAGRCAGICESGTKCVVPCGAAPRT